MFIMHKNKGFTLLEVLIALFIFTIVSIIMVGALHTVFNSQSSTEKKSARLSELQMALLIMSRDMQQIINRPITNKSNVLESPFIGSKNFVTFTHAGFTNPLGQLQRSTLQRVHYFLDKDNLLRETWPVLDQTSNTVSDKRKLLSTVTQLEFQYLNEKNQFQEEWPDKNNPKAVLPKAIRVVLTLKNWGKISQLYLIPGQSLEQSK